MIKDELLNSLGGIVKRSAEVFSNEDYEKIYEIRIRTGKPLIFMTNEGEYFVDNNFKKTRNIDNAIKVEKDDINKTVELMSRYSMYAFDEDVKRGFITIRGGHRAGIVGRVVLEKGQVKTIKGITGINIRISRELKGCSHNIMRFIADEKKVNNTMIISPPAYGKTTILRDIGRNISNSGRNVCFIDERSEIGGGVMGEVRNDLGLRTDVLDGCPKVFGMEMAIRSMSPQVIAVDEIGTEEDVKAMVQAFNSGVSVICTVHGKDIYDIEMKKSLSTIINEKYFDRYVVLGKRGSSFSIYDKNRSLIYKG